MGSKTRAAVSFLSLAMALPGCVGGTFGDHRSIEMFPLRAASDSESKDLKRCLKAARQAQEIRKRKTGKYARKVRDLPVDSYCNGFLMSQGGTEAGYEIRAELRESETTVRWSVNQQGVIEEHLDPETEPDLEL